MAHAQRAFMFVDPSQHRPAWLRAPHNAHRTQSSDGLPLLLSVTLDLKTRGPEHNQAPPRLPQPTPQLRRRQAMATLMVSQWRERDVARRRRMLPRDVVASARLFGPRVHPLATLLRGRWRHSARKGGRGRGREREGARGEGGGERRRPAESPCVMPSGQAP